jgi:hypothetical protein
LPAAILFESAQQFLQHSESAHAVKPLLPRLSIFDLLLYVHEPSRGESPIFAEVAPVLGGEADRGGK